MSYAVDDPRQDDGPPSVPFTERMKTSMSLFVKRMQVPQEQVLDLVTQLGIMFDTGLNLSAALEVLEKQAGSPHMNEFVGRFPWPCGERAQDRWWAGRRIPSTPSGKWP